MLHTIIPAEFTNRQELEEALTTHENEGLAVVALGETAGRRLFFCKDGHRYQHQVVAVTGRDDETLTKILYQREHEGWRVCAVGPCCEATVMILRREVQED